MAKKAADMGSGLVSNIKLGTRVRHTPDGAEGRIVWANAAAVKIQWDDGEKVTWKRAELGVKGLEVLDAVQAPEPQEATATYESATEPAAEVEASPAPEATEPTPEATEAAPEAPLAEQPTAPAGETTRESTPATPEAGTEPPAKKRTRRATPAEPKPTRPSALDAAARVLAEEGRPMNCQELIGAMAVRGYWTSPGGKTPAATLYSAMLREQQVKAEQARFVKVGKGMFALRPQA
jgi:hypothetical protein